MRGTSDQKYYHVKKQQEQYSYYERSPNSKESPLNNSSKLAKNIIKQIQDEKGQKFIEKHKKEAGDKFSATRISFPNMEAENNWES